MVKEGNGIERVTKSCVDMCWGSTVSSGSPSQEKGAEGAQRKRPIFFRLPSPSFSLPLGQPTATRLHVTAQSLGKK